MSSHFACYQVPRNCVPMMKQLSAMFRKRDREVAFIGQIALQNSALLKGVTEVTGDTVRRSTMDALRCAEPKCKTAEGQNLLGKKSVIANHEDSVMLCTYGNILLKVVKNAVEQPPNISRSHKDMSFHLKRGSGTTSGAPTEEYLKAAENRKCVVCANSLFGKQCNFQTNITTTRKTIV